MRSEKGQVLPYFLVMMIILILSWAMVINIAKLLRNRIVLQNAADNAALSAAVYKARVLNTLGLLNNLIGALLYGSEMPIADGFLSYYEYGVTASIGPSPIGFPVPLFPMGGYPPDSGTPGTRAVDSQENVGATLDVLFPGDTFIRAKREFVRSSVALQDSLMRSYYVTCPLLVHEIGRRQEINARGEYVASDATIIINQGLHLGLERNLNGVTFCRTTKLKGPKAFIAKGIANVLLAAVELPVEIIDIFKAEACWTERKSWLYADRSLFGKAQKIVVVARKSKDSPSNRGYPLLRNMLGISWPDTCAIAAAGLYNTGGPMFPVEEKGRPSNRISPVINEYRKARGHGWDAHLVPLKGMYEH